MSYFLLRFLETSLSVIGFFVDRVFFFFQHFKRHPTTSWLPKFLMRNQLLILSKILCTRWATSVLLLSKKILCFCLSTVWLWCISAWVSFDFICLGIKFVELLEFVVSSNLWNCWPLVLIFSDILYTPFSLLQWKHKALTTRLPGNFPLSSQDSYHACLSTWCIPQVLQGLFTFLHYFVLFRLSFDEPILKFNHYLFCLLKFAVKLL